MFTDMVGYSTKVQRDEHLALTLLEDHRRCLRAIFPDHQGIEIKTTGDGFLLEFHSALAAVHAAVAIQDALTRRNETLPAEHQVWIRIGIHLGDLEQREDDIFGDGVNIAARVEPLAEPGGIVVTQQVLDQVENKVPYRFQSVGQVELKNIPRPLEIYRLLAGGLGTPEPEPAHDSRPGSSEGGKSIAVLPFMNMSSDRENEFLSDGISDDLITALSQVKGLHVPARTSAFAFKGKNEDIRQIGNLLNVANVLEGSVRKSGNRLRITAQLIKVSDGFHLWSERYDREMQDVFDIQDEITRAIVNALKVHLGTAPGVPILKGQTQNTAAYECYLKGRELWGQRGVGLEKALHYFELAIIEDPKYSRAHCGLSDTYTLLGFYSYLPGREAADKAMKSALRARELDDTLADAHTSLACARLLRDWDWWGADADFRRAIKQDPKHIPTRYFSANLLSALGRFDEAIAQDEEAVRRDPLSVFAITHLAWMQIFARRFDQAILRLNRALEMQPDFFLANCYMGQALLATGRAQESVDLLKRAARGFRSFRNYRIRILFFCGKLTLYPL